MDAAGRARLGPKGPPTLLDFRAAIDDKGSVLGWESEVFVPDRPKEFAVTLLAGGARRTAAATMRIPGNIHQALGDSLHHSQHQGDRALARRDAVSPVVDPHAGPHAEHVRQRELRRRSGGRRRRRSARVPVEELEGPARRRTIASGSRSSPTGSRSRAPARPVGDVVKGRGVSYVKYELVRTYVGVVADVEVNRKTGKVTVNKFHVAHDCGQIINPDGLRNQIEGNVVQTVSRTLIEELQFDRSR